MTETLAHGYSSDSTQRELSNEYQHDRVANLANTKNAKKSWKMIETLAHGYSSDSTQRELSNEYQHDRV